MMVFFSGLRVIFNLATNIEKLDEEPASSPLIINSYGYKSLHEQSHGESFFALMTHRFGGKGLYILDEPEAALSPTRQMAMLTRMHQLIRQESQFIIATHSPIVLAYPNADIYELAEGKMYKSKYEDTEHYSITKDFLSDHERFLDSLLIE